MADDKRDAELMADLVLERISIALAAAFVGFVLGVFAAMYRIEEAIEGAGHLDASQVLTIGATSEYAEH